MRSSSEPSREPSAPDATAAPSARAARRPAELGDAAASGARDIGGRRVLTLERALRIGRIVLAVGGAPSMMLAPEGLPRLRTVELELSSVERENAGMRREVEVLRARVRKLREDPATVERLARDELGLVRETEIVFQFSK